MTVLRKLLSSYDVSGVKKNPATATFLDDPKDPVKNTGSGSHLDT